MHITTKPGKGNETVTCPGCSFCIGGDEPFCPFCGYSLWQEDDSDDEYIEDDSNATL